MREINEADLPTDGANYIAVHEYKGRLWATTYRVNKEGYTECYNECHDGGEDEWTVSFVEQQAEGCKFYTI